MDDIKAKQEIVDKIKNSTNILVTVSNNPSVDALSAALGLTLLLDKLEKHPTAIFSGSTPPAIAFLQPEKTFDDTTDSLRDFIIALNKDKADHLRYKVDGDVVKIFITPYKTTITSDDLQFSQGDFNVELIIALGVDDQQHLDSALEAHGQILHDAAIITVTAGEQTSTLGGIDWHDAQASSLGEMIAGLGEALKTDKTKSLLDQEIATALLTGIVAQTDRFSNTHTTSRVMTVAAQLMAAGADQQLIAVKLQESASETAPASQAVTSEDSAATEAATSPDSSDSPDISISHDDAPSEESTPDAAEASTPSADTPTEPIDQPVQPVDTPAPGAAVSNAYAIEEPTVATDVPADVPATTEAPVTPASTETLEGPTHAYLDTQPSFDGSVNGSSASTPAPEAAPEILTHESPAPSGPTSAYAPDGDIAQPVAPAATDPLLAPALVATPASLGLPMPPAVPDFSAPPAAMPTLPPLPTLPTLPTPTASPVQPEILGDILAPEPAPAAPEGSTRVIEPLTPASLTPPGPATPPPANDPGQFRIPGQ